MSEQKQRQLLHRLNEIGMSLERCGGALALLALGSVGQELERMDEYSDLDFFVIAATGCKQRFIEQLDWLENVHQLAYAFKNCDVGYKILFDDGIYGEYAVFELPELENAVYTGGRIVWKQKQFLQDDIIDCKAKIPSNRSISIDHVVGEAITNLYVGLLRYLRGEKMSALKFIQGYPIEGLMSVQYLLEPEVDYFPDAFGNERRIEHRFPAFANVLSECLQGYDKTPQSALALLAYLERIYPVDKRMSSEIRGLALRCIERDTAPKA